MLWEVALEKEKQKQKKQKQKKNWKNTILFKPKIFVFFLSFCILMFLVLIK